nr:hypothetical protein [Tanacetum cinerariifolium]
MASANWFVCMNSEKLVSRALSLWSNPNKETKLRRSCRDELGTFAGEGAGVCCTCEMIGMDGGGRVVVDNRGGSAVVITGTSTRGAESKIESIHVFKSEVENQLGKTVKAIRSDRGGEYISQEFKDYLKACGIVKQLTPPYTPQHNGVSERRNRTLLNMVRSMMSLATLPLSFWDYALESAARILNMVPTKKVDKTPYEIWHGKVPNLSYLKVWGCEAHVKRRTPDKLQQRSIKCIFVGYPKETMGYYFYYPPENKIVVERYADFLEKDFILQKESGRIVESEDEDILPSENTSKHPIEEEMLPPNAKVFKSKWIYKKKREMDGKVHIYKARLVAKGCTQTYGVGYGETFSPVADIRAIRILIAIAAYYDYEIWQMDVKTAFLNGFLEEEIYIEQSEGFIDPNYP